MSTLNSLRLVLGTRLDVDEELPALAEDDPLAPAYAVYEYLGWLLSQVVDALSRRPAAAPPDSATAPRRAARPVRRRLDGRGAAAAGPGRSSTSASGIFDGSSSGVRVIGWPK